MKMKTKFIITIGGILLTLGAFAQQDASFSQYFFNPLYINPAYAGTRGIFSGTAVYRTQWVGVNGAPTTEYVGMHGMVPNSNVGLGLQFYKDEVGPLHTSTISAIFAYHLHLSETMRLAFGLEGCMDNVSVSYNEINLENASDPTFTGSFSAWVPDANAGLYLYKDRFFAGFSVRHLLQPNFGLQENVGEANGNDYFFRTYYLTAGFVTNFTDNIGIRPSVLLKYVNAAPVDIDVNASLIFWDKFYIGPGLRTDKRIDVNGLDDILVLSVEYDVASCLRFGYSYDIYLNHDGPYMTGTHEIMLGWDISYTKTKMVSPKYF